jgi:hypothetical protein
MWMHIYINEIVYKWTSINMHPHVNKKKTTTYVKHVYIT